jgi:hypothetical protein
MENIRNSIERLIYEKAVRKLFPAVRRLHLRTCEMRLLAAKLDSKIKIKWRKEDIKYGTKASHIL